MRTLSRKYGVIRTRQQSLRDTPWRGSCVLRRHKTAYQNIRVGIYICRPAPRFHEMEGNGLGNGRTRSVANSQAEEARPRG